MKRLIAVLVLCVGCMSQGSVEVRKAEATYSGPSTGRMSVSAGVSQQMPILQVNGEQKIRSDAEYKPSVVFGIGAQLDHSQARADLYADLALRLQHETQNIYVGVFIRWLDTDYSSGLLLGMRF